MKDYYVYFMTNRSNSTLYIGMTNDLRRRVAEHKSGSIPGFTKQYRLHKLVYLEHTTDVYGAISREKQLKGWRRSKKDALIRLANPQWLDLSAEWALLSDGASAVRSLDFAALRSG